MLWQGARWLAQGRLKEEGGGGMGMEEGVGQGHRSRGERGVRGQSLPPVPRIRPDPAARSADLHATSRGRRA
uniref:Uncharacterized protein n=1 Tax=Oryza sativa subsp. japonica TaxID=39947 RepID=Q84ZQ1_ORYSJ|nr:hypothetical protein [Oryza sativa Japonica Group]